MFSMFFFRVLHPPSNRKLGNPDIQKFCSRCLAKAGDQLNENLTSGDYFLSYNPALVSRLPVLDQCAMQETLT